MWLLAPRCMSEMYRVVIDTPLRARKVTYGHGYPATCHGDIVWSFEEHLSKVLPQVVDVTNSVVFPTMCSLKRRCGLPKRIYKTNSSLETHYPIFGPDFNVTDWPSRMTLTWALRALAALAICHHARAGERQKRDITQMAQMLECLTGKYGFDLIDYGCFCGIGDYGKKLQQSRELFKLDIIN